ncbi:uncharacterized protein LOC128635144 isoform X1 [Ictalurus punctatus]|uniref:Uncharacterized protein LOC128635144 isoform X1 n=1 Tax=Ictalurus punctatus TaxID=7998 RepID=A0A9F7RTJ6_ICTPU|nr:uncharacterized protein LOC128635144 isoform X1 [Ictalurus punctatus]
MCVFGSSVRMQVCFLLLLIQLHVTEGCRLEGNGETKLITAYTGGSVLLPCSCTDLHTKPETHTWKKYTDGNNWVEISPEREQYKGRFQLVNDLSSGNLSLLISHLTEEDGGVYMCDPKGSEYRYFRLTVKDAPTRPSTSRPVITTTSPNPEPATKPTPVVNDKTTTRTETSSVKDPHTIIIIIIIIICTAVGVLLLLILGGVMYWKHRGQRRGQTETGDGQTGQRTQQKKQNDCDVLYTAINPQTKRNKAEEKDEVTYSTVVLSNTVRAAHTPVESGDTAVYAIIKTN